MKFICWCVARESNLLKIALTPVASFLQTESQIATTLAKNFQPITSAVIFRNLFDIIHALGSANVNV